VNIDENNIDIAIIPGAKKLRNGPTIPGISMFLKPAPRITRKNNG
jgi:hypothetical protein